MFSVFKNENTPKTVWYSKSVWITKYVRISVKETQLNFAFLLQNILGDLLLVTGV